MHATLLLVTTLALTGPQAPRQAAPAANGPARPTGCRITLIEDVNVAAQEPGVLTQMEAKEMIQYDEGTSMAKIDDTLQQAQLLERRFEYEAAKELAESPIEENYAKASAAVAQAEYEVALAANKRVTGAISQADLNRLRLSWHRSDLQIDKAQHDRKVNRMTADAKGARIKEIEGVIERKQVKAPISGMVVEVVKQRGEWVQAGDTILRMVRLDKLRVKGFLKASEYTTPDIIGRPVTVEVTLARGRKIQVPGKIVNVSPLVEGDEFAVWAEILNKQEGAHWLISSGLACDMAIDVGAALVSDRATPAARR